MISVHEHGLSELAADLERAPAEIVDKVKRVTGMAMSQIKKDARRRVRGHPYLPHLARSFTYDVTARGSLVVGQVGAEHERTQGRLDVFIEFGSPTSAPIPHWRPATDKELPVWADYLDKVAAEAIEKG